MCQKCYRKHAFRVFVWLNIVVYYLSVHRMVKGTFDDDDDDGIDLDSMEKFLPSLPVRNYLKLLLSLLESSLEADALLYHRCIEECPLLERRWNWPHTDI